MDDADKIADLDEITEIGYTRQVFLDLSTRHLPQEELERLRDWPRRCPVRVIPHEYGAWVNVPSVEHRRDDEPGRGEDVAVDIADEIGDRWADFPNLLAVLQQARRVDAWWINFDADSMGLIPHLPIFPW